MKLATVATGVVFLALGLGGGFFAATHWPQPLSENATPERKILYYRNPMGLPDTSPVPKKDEMGMDYIPVYADETAPPKAEPKILYYRNPMGLPDTSPVPKKDEMGMDYIPVYAEETPPPKAEPKILYYRNPMGLPDTSLVPKKDEMGMDYIPVYAEEADSSASSAGSVKVSAERLQTLGVRTTPVELAPLNVEIRAAGSIAVNERRQYDVAPKFGGWIEHLKLSAVGDSVRRGEVLMEIYSPELVAAQEEYLIALDNLEALGQADTGSRNSAQRLVDAARQRMRYWDVPEVWLRQLQQQRQVRRTVPLLAPADGVVLEKTAIQGRQFMPGEVLFQIAELDPIWLQADVFEQDLPLLHVGQAVQVNLSALPGETLQGQVDFVYPTLNAKTRTARVRILLPNPKGLLKPSMYAQVNLRGSLSDEPQLQVPTSAIIDSGLRQVVLLELGEGRFAPREVQVGYRSGEVAQILTGLKPGDRVVSRGNFLIDAESNLQAVFSALRQEDTPTPSSANTPPSSAADMPATPHADHEPGAH